MGKGAHRVSDSVIPCFPYLAKRPQGPRNAMIVERMDRAIDHIPFARGHLHFELYVQLPIQRG